MKVRVLKIRTDWSKRWRTFSSVQAARAWGHTGAWIYFWQVLRARRTPTATQKRRNRQREALTARTRSATAKAVAADRKARGMLPGFMKNGRKAK